MQTKKFLSRKIFNRRGQALVLYALLIPIVFLFVGVAIDLGWYFINVSRLQNAADAAVLAGAQELIKVDQDREVELREGLGDYYIHALVKPPSDLNEYYQVFFIKEIDGVYQKVTTDLTKKNNDMAAGKAESITYANKNLSVSEDAKNVYNVWSAAPSTNNGNKVDFHSALYAKAIDIQKKENGLKYYEVTLTEKVAHLFLRNWEPMEAKVVAYALLKPHDKDLVTGINELEKTEVIANWEYQNRYQNYSDNWNHYRQTVNGSKAVSYSEGDAFRTETVNVQQSGGSLVTNDSAHKGKKYFGESELDSINIDFNQDVRFSGGSFTTDWDLRSETPTGRTISRVYNNGWDENHGYDLRIQGRINLNSGWKDRNYDDLQPDILWTRIESDPIWSKMPWGTQDTLNSVHQMILNVHEMTNSNESYTKTITVKDEAGNDHTVYKYRPFFVFYMGPETNEDALNKTADQTFSEIDKSVRKSQPVILNLYEDWNAIIYMPNSPVIINGNGHTLNGFVIAKEYLWAKTAEDYTDNDYLEVTDGYGNTIFVEESNTLTEEALNALYANHEFKVDSHGNISVYKKPNATDELYKRTLMKYRNCTEADISTVTFENDGYNTLQSFYVVTSDLLLPGNSEIDTTDDKYVKVFKGTTEYYINKKNLPYVKVRRNSVYPYVSVYDLKTQRIYDSKGNSISNGVRFVDDDSVNDSTKIDLESEDSRFVKEKLMTDYSNNYIPSKITKVVEDGCKYFNLTTKPTADSYKYLICDVDYLMEVGRFVADYRKLEKADGTVVYVKEDTSDEYNEDGAKYYVKVVPEGSTGKDAQGNYVENYIIVDNKGDIQVKEKPLSDSSYGLTRPTNADEQPDDEAFQKKLKDVVTGDEKDYRILDLEVVYDKKRAFNLSDDSHYSYFQIPSLERQVYQYLNVDELNGTVNGVPSDKYLVDDMFFTTKRASWID